MKRALSVWWNDAVVGVLHLDAEGGMVFKYAAEWLGDESKPPLSISLPKRAAAYKRRACRPFFAGLLPEERSFSLPCTTSYARSRMKICRYDSR